MAAIILSLVFIFLFGELFLDKFQTKLLDFKNLALNNQAGSYFEIPIHPNLTDLFIYLPKALYNVFFRPLFPKEFGLLSALAAFEHLLLLLLLVLAFFQTRKSSFEASQLNWLCLALVLPMAFLIGSTVPVLGAIVRYKVIFLPFYLFMLLTFVDLKKAPILKSFL
jgi:hypothetical protein